MQNKGAIRLFAILLALASLYSLSFTFFTKKVESDAEELAKGDLVKKNLYLDSIRSEGVYNFLWLRNFTYAECKEREINYGLDLKGGMNVTLEISVVDLIRELAVDKNDSIVNRCIQAAKKYQENSQDDFVTLFGRAFYDLYPNLRLANYFSKLENKDKVNYQSTNEEVLTFLKEQAQSAIDNSFNILRTRIDRFGVTQPNIQSIGSGRVLVELPGVKEPERVRKLLQGTAKLEFWETFDNAEVWRFMESANIKIKELKLAQSGAVDTVAKVDTATVAKDSTKKGIALLDQMAKDTSKKDSSKVAGKTDAAKEYPLFSVLIPRTTQNGQLMKGPVVGVSHVKDTAKVNRYLAIEQVKKIFPMNLRFMWTNKAFDKGGNFFELVAIKVPRDGKAPMEGDVITNARPESGQNSAAVNVAMSMNQEGSAIWARLTKENIGKSIAIVLDGYVYSFPTVQNEITGGNSQITGNFTIAEGKDLANVLQSGKLPAPAKIVEEAVVGPSLGSEAVTDGMLSFIIAFALVLLFMIAYYAKAGYVANIALLVNVFLIFGVLASMGAVLTLPGIAGIIITLGMAVDSNIIIYERIREEVNAGKGIKLAVADGFKHAMPAIVDGNLTTMITGIILYIFGSGPIQGFATTLVIGLLTSMFTAIFVSRLVFERLLDKKKAVTFGNKISYNIYKHIDWKILEQRKKMYILSAVILGAGIISIGVRGWNYGVDFTGGRTFIVRFDNPVKTEDVQQALKPVFDHQIPDVKTYGNANQVKITTKYLIDDKAPNTDSIVEHKLYEGLTPMIGNNVDYATFDSKYKMSSQKVGPTVADDIIWGSILAVFFALIGIFLYIFIRFRSWIYGLGGVLSLLHDVVFVLGWYSILWSIMPFSMEIDQAFIAAILTVVGYSINDTVIVYDRIREYKTLYPKREHLSLFNGAINSTFGRTINTVMTVMITLAAMFIFGGEVIRGFIFAMLIGVGVGTYSSIFIASAIVYDTMEWDAKRKAKKEGKA